MALDATPPVAVCRPTGEIQWQPELVMLENHTRLFVKVGSDVGVETAVAEQQVIREIAHGSPAYWATVQLRDLILRKPLGTHFMFRVFDQGDYLLDPWILFWEMFRQQRDERTKAAR